MKITVENNPEFSVNYAKCDRDWLSISIYDDRDVEFELEMPHNNFFMSSEQLRMLADAADHLAKTRRLTRDAPATDIQDGAWVCPEHGIELVVYCPEEGCHYDPRPS